MGPESVNFVYLTNPPFEYILKYLTLRKVKMIFFEVGLHTHTREKIGPISMELGYREITHHRS